MAGRLCGLVAQLAECSHGFEYQLSSPMTLSGLVWVRVRVASSKWTVSSVPTGFRADSGTNLIKFNL